MGRELGEAGGKAEVRLDGLNRGRGTFYPHKKSRVWKPAQRHWFQVQREKQPTT